MERRMPNVHLRQLRRPLALRLGMGPDPEHMALALRFRFLKAA
jgi:hypothetical protein